MLPTVILSSANDEHFPKQDGEKMDFLNPLIIVDSNKYGLNSVSLFF